MRRSILFALAVFLTAGSGEPARAADDPAALKKLVKQGDRAVARRDWDEAARDLGEAAKLAPDDTRLRDKLRRALERRAQAREARAAKPPPPPDSGFSDGPQDSGIVTIYKSSLWYSQLKREALEARADAEAIRAKPDEAKIGRLREAAAERRKDEKRLTALIAKERGKDEASRKEGEKAMENRNPFEGIGGVDPEQIKTGALH